MNYWHAGLRGSKTSFGKVSAALPRQSAVGLPTSLLVVPRHDRVVMLLPPEQSRIRAEGDRMLAPVPAHPRSVGLQAQ